MDENVEEEKKDGVLWSSVVLGLMVVVCIAVFVFDRPLGRIMSATIIAAAFIVGLMEWAFAIRKKLPYVSVYNRDHMIIRAVNFLLIWSIGLGIAFLSCVYLENGVFIVLLVALSIYAADGAGWLVGGYLVRSKNLSDIFDWAKVSPNKSISGTIAYFIIAWSLLGILTFAGTSFGVIPDRLSLVFIAFAIFAPIVGFFGDFYESGLKRCWNMKHSAEYAPWGKIWGRHGGCTDRLDSLVAISSFPIVALTAAITCLVVVISTLVVSFFNR